MSCTMLRRLSPLSLFFIAGAAFGQVVNWTGSAGPNWFDSQQSGTCPNSQLQFFNNFGQVGCGGPVFPTAANYVVVGAATGPNINGSFTITGLSLASGGTMSWASGDLNFGTSPSGGFSNSGTFLHTGGSDRSIYSSTITNAGTFQAASPSSLLFQTVAFQNNGLIEFSRGTWTSYTGVNSFTSPGSITKISADTFTMSVPTLLSGQLDVQQGNLQFLSTSLTCVHPSSIAVQNGASLNLNGVTISGALAGAILGSGSLNVFGNLTQSGPLTMNVISGAGLNWTDGTWNGNGQTLANSAIFTLSGAPDRSWFSNSFTNTGLFRSTSAGQVFFQTVAIKNDVGGVLQWNAGNWINYTGTNSLENRGLLEKYSVAAFNTSVSSILGGTILVHQGTVQYNSAAIDFQNPATTVYSGAAFNLNNISLKGSFAPTLAAGAALNIFGGTTLSGDLAIASPSGAGVNWTAGDWQFSNRTLTNNGMFTISQNVDRSLFSGSIQNAGTFFYTTPATLYFQTLAITNPGIIEWQRGSWVNYTGPNSLASAGTIRKTSADPFNISVATTISGLLDVQNGSVVYSTTSLNFQPGSNITLAPTTTLRLSNDTLRGSLKASTANASLLMVDNTTLSAALTLQATGGRGMDYASGELQLNNFTLTNNALFTVSGAASRSVYAGAIVNNGTLEATMNATLYFQTLSINNTGTLRWSRGGWSNYTGANLLTNSGTLEKVGPDAFSSTVALIHSGNLNINAGSVTLSNAPLEFIAGSNIDVSFGANLSMNSCTFKGSMSGFDGGPGTLNVNTLTLSNHLATNLSGAQGFNWSSGEGSFNNYTLTNNGLLTFTGGNRSAYSGIIDNNAWFYSAMAGDLYFQTLRLNNNAGATTEWSNGNYISYTGTNSLYNQGTFIKTGLDTRSINVPIVNSGEFSVEQGTASTASFTQNPGATFRTTIYSAAAAGRLISSSPIALQGNLAVYFLPLFAPAVAQSWTVLSAPSISGTFDNIIPVAFPAGRQVNVAYTANSVIVTLLAPGCVADLNHDNVVDDADFSLFVGPYNIFDCADPSMPAGCPSDFNGDGVVNDIDFQLFVYAYNALLCPE